MFAHENSILSPSQVITRENAHIAGVGDIFDRVLVELVGKMKEMKMVRKLGSKIDFCFSFYITNKI